MLTLLESRRGASKQRYINVAGLRWSRHREATNEGMVSLSTGAIIDRWQAGGLVDREPRLAIVLISAFPYNVCSIAPQLAWR